MKKSELRTIIREEITKQTNKQSLKEDIVTNFLNYVDTLITTGRTAAIKKEVEGEFKKRLDVLEQNKKELNAYIKGNLSKEEISILMKKLIRK
jgi:hypothetical protein